MPFTYACARCSTPVERRARATLPRVYCSRACCYADKTTVPLRPCRACGQDFKPMGGSDRPYCSRACYETSRTNVVGKTCPVCAESFMVNASQAERYTVCSAACRRAETKYVDCERCGTRFRAEKELNRRYCSERCRRPPVHVTCRTCATEFRILPGAAGRSFCSVSCYRKFTGETALETRVRLALMALGLDFEQEYRLGRWSIDFALPADRIAIEADGDYWHDLCMSRDARRDAQLANMGWRVVRLRESDVNAAPDLGELILGRLHHARATLSSAQRQRG